MKKILALLAFSLCAFGQVTTYSTTLTRAVGALDNTFCLASSTGVTLPSLALSTAASYLAVDIEVAQITSRGPVANCYFVRRGVQGTANAAHSNGAVVTINPPANFTGDPSRPNTGVSTQSTYGAGGGAVTASAVAAAIQSQAGCTTAGFVWIPASNTCVSPAGGSVTNGTNGQALTGNGAGGYGTPVTLAASASTDATNAANISSGTLPLARLPTTQTGITIDGVSPSTLGFLDATSSVQTQLNGKQPTITLLPVANGGTGTATPGLVAGTNITSITGTWPNQTINATATGGTPTNGSAGQGLTSNGAGGFGSPLSFATSALTDTTNATNITTGTLAAARVAALPESGITNLVSDLAAKQLAGSANTNNAGITTCGGTGATQQFAIGTPAGTTPSCIQVPYAAVTGTPTLPTFPTGTILGTTDTQTTTNKTVNGVTPATFAFLDPTSSVQTQLNGKQATITLLPVANGGTGTATPGIVAGTNVTVTGSFPNQTVNSSAGGGTVTHTVGALTSTAIVTGNGTADAQTPSSTTTLDSSGNISTPGTITSGAGGSGAGIMAFVGGTQATSITAAPTNSAGFVGPSAAPTGKHFLSNPSTGSAGNQFLLFGAEASSISTGAWMSFTSTNLSDSALLARLASPAFTGTATAVNLTVSGTCTGCGTGGTALGGVNAQTVSYTLISGDSGKLVTMNGASLTATLPLTPPSTTWTTNIQNLNATSLTVSRNGLLINGAASNLTLLPYQFIPIYTDGTNYFARPPYAAGTNVTIASNPYNLVINSSGGASPTTTKGDLGGFDTVSNRVPVGADLKVLVADSTQTLGLRYGIAPQFYGNAGNLGTTIAAGATNFSSFANVAPGATETTRQISVPGGTLKNFYLKTSSAQSTVGALTCTVKVNSVNTAIVIVIAANAAAGTFSDLTNTATVSNLDAVGIGCVNAGTAISATLSANQIVLF